MAFFYEIRSADNTLAGGKPVRYLFLVDERSRPDDTTEVH